MYHRNAKAKAFTLVELLVVMAVIVLALALAVPAIKPLTGTRSEQAAQNIVQAVLARARTEAIGHQRVEGVMFAMDSSDRVMCVRVAATENQGLPVDRQGSLVATPKVHIAFRGPGAVIYDTGQPYVMEIPSPVYLDVVDGDTATLPAGVVAFSSLGSGGATAPYAGSRFLGYNTRYYTDLGLPAGNLRIGPVILFGADGRLVSQTYGLHLSNSATASAPRNVSGLGQLMEIAKPPAQDWPPQNISAGLISQPAIVLVDMPTLLAQASPKTGQPYTVGNETNPQTQSDKDTWIGANATMIFVDRGTGTLVRGE